ncbi:MAG: hypothetical protein K6T66_08910 [Peptococcaceae bacterium]|nr:hypothetical protein [Peptococcaceae bacterium]
MATLAENKTVPPEKVLFCRRFIVAAVMRPVITFANKTTGENNAERT